MRWVILCVLAVGCGDNNKGKPRDDAGMTDASPSRLEGCLDQPGIPSAPNGQLPCDLVPPGVQL